MVEIPADKVTELDLAEWFKLQSHLATIKTAEHFARVRLFKGFFKDPKEGTNTHVLSDSYQLKGVHVVNRSIELAVLNGMVKELAAAGINYTGLIEWKPSLKISAYRELTAEQRQLFDQCLIVKDGSPQLEIAPPKAAKNVGEQAAPAAPGTDYVFPNQQQPAGEQTLTLTPPPNGDAPAADGGTGKKAKKKAKAKKKS